jgi:hypothetical protein
MTGLHLVFLKSYSKKHSGTLIPGADSGILEDYARSRMMVGEGDEDDNYITVIPRITDIFVTISDTTRDLVCISFIRKPEINPFHTKHTLIYPSLKEETSLCERIKTRITPSKTI